MPVSHPGNCRQSPLWGRWLLGVILALTASVMAVADATTDAQACSIAPPLLEVHPRLGLEPGQSIAVVGHGFYRVTHTEVEPAIGPDGTPLPVDSCAGVVHEPMDIELVWNSRYGPTTLASKLGADFHVVVEVPLGAEAGAAWVVAEPAGIGVEVVVGDDYRGVCDAPYPSDVTDRECVPVMCLIDPCPPPCEVIDGVDPVVVDPSCPVPCEVDPHCPVPCEVDPHCPVPCEVDPSCPVPCDEPVPATDEPIVTVCPLPHPDPPVVQQPETKLPPRPGPGLDSPDLIDSPGTADNLGVAAADAAILARSARPELGPNDEVSERVTMTARVRRGLRSCATLHSVICIGSGDFVKALTLGLLGPAGLLPFLHQPF